jgi:hypothetical protein
MRVNRCLAGGTGGTESESKFYLEWRRLSTGAHPFVGTPGVARETLIRYNFKLFAPPNRRGFLP